MENVIAIYICLTPLLIFLALSSFFCLYAAEIRENIIKRAFKDALNELYEERCNDGRR